MNGNGNGHGKIRFQLIDFADITPNTQQRYLIKNLIPKDGLIVVWGPPKCGKSFFVTDLAMHVALGWQYRDKRVEQGTVIYIACEGQTGFRNRIEAFRQDKMAEGGTPPPFKLLPTRLDLAHDCDLLMYDVVAQLGASSCSLIVIDTLNRSLGGSENSDEDMAAYILACDKLRERFGCAVLVIHHCGIEATRPRGHTSLQGAVDTQIAVKKDEEGIISATVEYMKDGEDGEKLLNRLARVAIGEDMDGDGITSCVVDYVEPSAVYEMPKPKARTPLTDSAKLALKEIKKGIAKAGDYPPPDLDIPPLVKTIPLERWRALYYAAVPADTGEEARKKAFQRAREKLQAANLVGINNEYCWLI